VFVILASGNYLAIGAALSLAVLLGGPVSGGAFNPAVALAYLAAGKLAASDVVPFIVVEVAGALAAFQLYKMIL
jgi:aquaporin Z